MCILKDHTKNPFHAIEEWKAPLPFWRRTTLYDLGVIIHLGHDGNICPHARPARFMIIVHERGIDPALVQFCGCIPMDVAPEDSIRVADATQLLESGFWPGSWVEPRTAYTLHVMKRFQLLANTANVNAQDYMAVLAATADNVEPDISAVSYCTSYNRVLPKVYDDSRTGHASF